MPSDDFRIIPARTVIRLGYVPRWLVGGPFPIGDRGEVYRLYRMGRLEVPEFDPLGGEEFVKPRLGMRQGSNVVPSTEVAWSEHEVASPHVGFSSLFPSTEYGIAYAATYLSSPSDQLLICNFKPQMVGRLFLNHEPVAPDFGFVQIPLKAGPNVLLVKVLGGSAHRIGWGAVCSFRRAKIISGSNLAMTAVLATGFYRGTALSPEMEVEFVLANTSKVDIFDVAANISCNEVGTEITRSVEVVRGGETRRMLYGLPMTTSGIDAGRLKLDVMVGSTKASISSQVKDVRPPDGDATIYLGAGFHCDPIWTNTQSMYNDLSLHNVTQYLDFCRADPEHRVILHELDYLKPYLDFYPEDRDYLKARVKEGRVILGGSYCEPNEKNISGEQLIRNILYGKLFANSQFGADPKIYHAWDVFGHVPQLSQILSKSGFLGIVWSKYIRGFPTLFRHMSLDGSTVLHRRISYGFSTRSFDEFRERAYVGLKEMQSLGHSVDLRMDATDFKSPTAWMLGRTDELRTLLPRVEVADPARFFEDILKEESSGILVPVTSRDASQYHVGTCQSRIELKIANRLAEIGLCNAELLSTLAYLLGRPYPDLALDKAWRQLLFNSHHDAITGTSCDKSYLDMMQGYREALALIGGEVGGALKHITGKVDTSHCEGIPLLVFNTLNWKRMDVARANLAFKSPVASFDLLNSRGRKTPYCVVDSQAMDKGVTSATIEFVAEAPSVGYSTYCVMPLSEGSLPKWRCKSGSMEIENDTFKVATDPARGGGITSITDKRTGRELVPSESRHLVNEIAILKEKNDRHEPSWEFYTTGEKMFSGEYPAEVSVSSCGPTARMVVRNTVAEKCELVREIWLRKGIGRIDFRTEIRGYDKEDDLFVALFPQDLQGGAPTYEERFGAIVKHPGKTFLDYRTGGTDAFSDCVIHSTQNFFDFGSTTKIRFVDRKARTVASHPLGSVALIMPHSKEVQLILRRLQKALANRGILTTPCFDDDDATRRETLRHEDSSEPRDKNRDLPNTNFRIAVGMAGNNSYSISVLEKVDEQAAEELRDGIAKLGFGFIFTLDRNVPEGWKPVPVLLIEASDAEHLEKVMDFLVEGLETGDLILPENANSVGSSLVEDYGISILNRGNMANTVEPDGTMSLLLKHTSNWSRTHLEERFIPEKKDHLFLYSMYPHPGSWREAGSYRQGWEYNVPLLCVQTDAHKGILPRDHSFLSIGPENLVLSALKPADNPIAGFQATASDPSKGLILRIYDAEGRSSQAKFTFAFPVESVWKTDLLENRSSSLEASGESFSDAIGPFSIETYEVKPERPLLDMEEPEARQASEPVQPIYTRYWKENLGAAPIGFQPVAVSIQGLPVTEAGGRGTSINRISVSIANNYVDRTISGDAVLEAPQGWRIVPEKIWYEIPAQQHASYDVVFSFSGLRRTGLIRVRLAHDGQLYEDVIEIGEASKLTYTGGGSVYQDVLKAQTERALEWSVMVRDDKAYIRVKNPHNERVDGGVALITPHETWSKEEVGEYSLLEMGPRVRAFHVPPKSFQVLEFELGRTDPPFWAFAKLFYMGRTDYKRVR